MNEKLGTHNMRPIVMPLCEKCGQINECSCDKTEIARLRAEVERLSQEPHMSDLWEEVKELRTSLAKAEAMVRAAEAELGKPFVAGTQITNCIVHMSLDISQRPRDCDLCLTDILNHHAYAIRVNEWLNARLDEVRATFAGYRERA